MLDRLAQYLTEVSVELGVIGKEDRELYLFSYRDMLAQLSHWVALLVFGLIVGELMGTLLFMLFFIPLRMYAGGYHERSYGKCFSSSLFIYLGVVLVSPILVPYATGTLAVAVAVGSGCVIFRQAPVADPNKPLDMNETKKYRKICRIIAVTETLVIAAMSVVDVQHKLILYATIGIALAAGLTVIKVKTSEQG